MKSKTAKERYFVRGEAYEAWEDTERPFGWERERLEAYVARGSWVALFNALSLAGAQAAGTESYQLGLPAVRPATEVAGQ